MKKLAALLLTFVLVLGLCACGGSKEASLNFAPADLSAKLLDSKCFTDLMSEMDNAVAFEIYGLDSAKVDSASIYLGTGATAEEIAVFKAKDADGAKAIKEAMDGRVQAQIKAYENYVPTEVPKLKEAIVAAKDLYVVYVTSADAGSAKGIIDEFMR